MSFNAFVARPFHDTAVDDEIDSYDLYLATTNDPDPMTWAQWHHDWVEEHDEDTPPSD